MFVVVEQAEAQEIEASARTKGMFDAFLTNLGEFYTEWSKDNEGKFLISLTKNQGDPFYGKKVDSLYTGLQQRITKKELKQEWRLIRQDGALYIGHL